MNHICHFYGQSRIFQDKKIMEKWIEIPICLGRIWIVSYWKEKHLAEKSEVHKSSKCFADNMKVKKSFICCSSWEFKYGQNSLYKVAVQCTNIKFTSAAYSTSKMVKRCNVVSIKVTSVHVMHSFSVYSEFDTNSVEIDFCVQFFARLLPNTDIFHWLRSFWSEKFKRCIIYSSKRKRHN